jgi:hypothetical protein
LKDENVISHSNFTVEKEATVTFAFENVGHSKVENGSDVGKT